MNSWSRTDDMIVCVSYLEDGVKVTDALRAGLPHHEAGSIRMRLQNFEYLVTGGASGLGNTSAQQREVWETVRLAGQQVT
jgi:hypothetical protein